MTRRTRIAFELFGPGLIAGILINLDWVSISCWKVIAEGKPWDFEPGIFVAGMTILAAYMFSGIQGIFYMIVMEWRFAHGLDPESWKAVWLSTLLGFLSGMILFAFILLDQPGRKQITAGLSLGGIGIAVGFVLGSLIKIWSSENKTEQDTLR